MNTVQTAKLGWRPDAPDHRDLRYSLLHVVGAAPLVSHVDLRSKCPPVYDQGPIGSCTANAGAALAQVLQKKLGKSIYEPSRLFIYWNARLVLDETSVDNGATLRDTMSVMSNYGLPHERFWWYNTDKFAVKPNKGVYADGVKRKLGRYMRLNNTDINELRSCLADGFPFVFGISVYSSFVSGQVAGNGIVPMPYMSESIIGGHALLCVGYDDATRLFTFRNSWGDQWGQGGYGFIPYEYLTNNNLADDFWTARTLHINI